MNKMLALSFDDGTQNDERLVKLLNDYEIKATFHINGGLFPPIEQTEGDRLPLSRLKSLYIHHEVAAHGFTHPDLTSLSDQEIHNELIKDIETLDQGFDQSTMGFAYPFGLVNERVIQRLTQTTLIYARTIDDTHRFDVPQDLYRLNPTCHCKDKDLLDLADQFVNSSSNEPQFFLIWGHSIEFVTEEDWARFEAFLQRVSHKNDIYYGSILECVQHLNHQKT